jgi:hypothetical protein
MKSTTARTSIKTKIVRCSFQSVLRVFSCLVLASTAPCLDDFMDVVVSVDHASGNADFFATLCDEDASPMARPIYHLFMSIRPRRKTVPCKYVDAYYHPNTVAKLMQIARQRGDIVNVKVVSDNPQLSWDFCGVIEKNQQNADSVF